MFFFILGGFYHADVYLSVNVSFQFDFNLLFDAMERGWYIMIGSWALLLIERWVYGRKLNTTAQSLVPKKKHQQHNMTVC